jgi:hypothetical protein
MEEITYIIVVPTTQGPITERHTSYEEARRRIDNLPAELLAGIPLLFKELPDGSQRLVREDGKPLQVHRLPYDEAPIDEEDRVPVVEENLLGELLPPRLPEWEDLDDEPISFDDLPPPDPHAL